MLVSIFGAAGFIGTALDAELRRRGLKVALPSRSTPLDRPPKGGWGTVVWAAGLTADFRRRPHDTVSAHVGDLNHLLSGGGVDRLVYLSSTRVYQRMESAREADAVLVQTGNPFDLYNLSKLAGESLCLSCGLEGVAVARLSNIVGPNEVGRETFLGAICREAKGGQIKLQSALTSEKDYLWIDDAVRVLSELVCSNFYGIMNVAAGKNTTHQEWMEALCSFSGASYRVLPGASVESFPRIDTSLMNMEFGSPAIDPLCRVRQMFAPLSLETSLLKERK